MILFLYIQQNTSFASLLINEVLYDAATGISEEEGEWVEICNSTEEDIDLSGYTLENAGSSWSLVFTFPTGSNLKSGGYLVVGPAETGEPFTTNLQNGGSNTDGIRLLTPSGTVVDTVLYDENNTNMLVDDLGGITGPFAPDVSAGHSIARATDCTDSNNDGSDWIDESSPTMGTTNIYSSGTTGGGTTGGGSGSCDSSGVVINEFLADPSGSDSGHEWVELLNTTNQQVDLSGWILSGGSSSFSTQAEIPSGITIPAGSYLLIGDEDVVVDLGNSPNVIDSLSLGNAGSNADALRLENCFGGVVDTVIYGEVLNESDPWVDDLGNTPSVLTPKPKSGQSLGRIPDGFDSDIGSNFQLLDFVSPWEPNDLQPTCAGSDFVKINEFIPNPDSEETSSDETYEWIELYNNSTQPVDLGGWSIQWGTSSFSNSFTIPSGVSIDGESVLLIGGEGVSNPVPDVIVPVDNDFSFGSGGSNADAVRLLHCGPGVADTVIYGPTSDDDIAENTDGWTDDLGNVAISIAPKPSAGASLSRRMDGVDTDDNGLDFYLSLFVSPGYPNPVVACESGNYEIKINEAIPNPDGTDSGQEYIELYNTSDQSIDLDGWSIEVFGSSWNEKHVFGSGTTIEPGQFFILAEEDVPAEVADDYGSLSLGNASSGVDGIRLKDCPGDVQDLVFYAKEGYEPDSDEDEVDVSSGIVRLSESGTSFGRYPDGADSDTSSADFQTDMVPSPGMPNNGGVDIGTDTGDDNITPKETGCSKQNQPPAPDDPSSKCQNIPVEESLFAMILAVLYVRRRR